MASTQVYSAVYSGIPVHEMNCRQVAVMRRRADSYLNATQILKVAGVDKGRRTKILEREVQVGEHEKVQGGYGKYQGTWIPFDRGVEIARQYGVEELLRPLFEFQSGPDDPMETPRKIRRPTAPKMRSESMMMMEAMNGGGVGGDDRDVLGGPPKKKSRQDLTDPHFGPNSSFGYYPMQQQQLQHSQIPLVRHPQSPSNGERYRAVLMSVFLNHETHKIPELLTNSNPPPDLDIDLIIDDQGHTSLHWAAALARVNILQLLLNLGADPRRVNFNGESALIRAVLVTNNYDSDTFYDLLTLLHSAIDITDKKGRSLIHHIALTAGIKGRVQASRYYLDTFIEMMTKTGMDVCAIIDLQDKNGDTALNIAARIANRTLVEQLLRVGADPEIPNRAGLRPVDFGLEDQKLAVLFQKDDRMLGARIEGDVEQDENNPDGENNAQGSNAAYLSSFDGSGQLLHPRSPMSSFKRSSQNINNSFSARGREMVGEFEAVVLNLESELAAKDAQIQESLRQIRAVTRDLGDARKVVQHLTCRVASLENPSNFGVTSTGDHSELLPPLSSSNTALSDPARTLFLERQVSHLRAVLEAKNIPVDLESYSPSSATSTSIALNPSTFDLASYDANTTETKATQLIAQVLNVPITSVTQNLVDPLLTAVKNEDLALDSMDEAVSATIISSAVNSAVKEEIAA